MRVLTLSEAHRALEQVNRLRADGQDQSAASAAIALRDRLRASVARNPDLLECLQKVEAAFGEMQTAGLSVSAPVVWPKEELSRRGSVVPLIRSPFTVSRHLLVGAGIVALVLVLIGVTSLVRGHSAYTAYAQSAKLVLEQLDKLQAATETGINYTRYCEKIGDANYEFKRFEETYGNADTAPYESARKILAAWHEYKEVVTFWKDKIDGVGGRQLNEDLIQSSWSLAGNYTADAKRLLTENK